MAPPNFANRTLFHSDNLPILQGMDSETVDLIATDPPFNKGRDFHATPDSLARGARFQDRWSWERDVHEAWTDAIKDDFPAVWSVIQFARDAYGDDMGAFLCFMGVRLMEMHRVLKPTGSLYLHCDPTASHYLKALMDAIFGRRQFRNEIVWAYTGPGSPNMRQFNRKHDIILWYARGREWTFNRDEVHVPHKNLNTNRKGRVIADPITPEVRDEYLKIREVPETWWSEFTPVGRIASERVGYPTQKPLALYERIIKASSNPGDIVLDPFSGCATTPIAAERLERQWVAIDLWEEAYGMVLQRLRSVGLALPAGVLSDPENPSLLTDRDVHLETDPPVRTDDGDAAPALKLPFRVQRPTEPWQKLTHAEICAILEKAQSQGGAQVGHVVCVGCGISLPARHFELDHINPRAQGGENWITNRVLLCVPCNRRKKHELTLVGLQRENKRENDMENESAARESWDRARIAASRARDGVA